MTQKRGCYTQCVRNQGSASWESTRAEIPSGCPPASLLSKYKPKEVHKCISLGLPFSKKNVSEQKFENSFINMRIIIIIIIITKLVGVRGM